MSRGTMSRRRGARAPEEAAEECPVNLHLVEESDRRADRLDAENQGLREALEESEAWYRLLVADHAALGKKHEQVGRKAGELRAEVDRLGSSNRELEALVGRPEGPGRSAVRSKERSDMMRIGKLMRSAREHKWGAALAVALATLLARDPGVRELFSAALAKVRPAGEAGESARDPSASGFVRYAVMIQAGDEAEKARSEYNRREADLKGDDLLEAQDRLRAAKARHRQARLAFLPELARRCELARLPVPREAAEALASLRQGDRD